MKTYKALLKIPISLVFSVLASIVIVATAYPTQGATGIAKRSNVGKRDSSDIDVNDNDYEFKDYRKRAEGKRDSEEIGLNDIGYSFGDYRKREQGKRELKEVDLNDIGYSFGDHRK
ncbi:hypothetical protein BDR04DRAFT_784759 [Suillus decipiens]|nr:hypothetical protein BDR04DRAFT_784759 [Suillus decipiens]